jgi:hypothetical protein
MSGVGCAMTAVDDRAAPNTASAASFAMDFIADILVAVG